MRKKVIIFLRAHNDLDHITPIAYKLAEKSFNLEVIAVSRNVNLSNDYRIRFLSSYENIQINHISKYHFNWFRNILVFSKTPKKLVVYFYQQTRILLDKLKLFSYSFERPYLHSFLVFDRIIEQTTKDTEKVVFCFDHNVQEFTTSFSNRIRAKGYKIIGLPHGDLSIVSKMGGAKVCYNCFDSASKKMNEIFDYIVFPNSELFRFFNHNKYTNIDGAKINILGSPRYNEEWVNKNGEIISQYLGEKKKLNIVFFMKYAGWPIHFSEFLTTINIISQFKDISLVLIPHTRLSTLSIFKLKNFRIKLKTRKLKNVKVLKTSMPSSSFIHWADLVIDLGSSISFEAIMLNKNMLAPDYLHPDYSTMAYNFRNAEAKCRDHVYKIIQNSLESKDFKTYTCRERAEFIKKHIHVNGVNVLDGYVKFFEEKF